MLRAHDVGAGGISKFVSSGLDGRIVVWGVSGPSLEGRVSGMSLHR